MSSHKRQAGSATTFVIIAIILIIATIGTVFFVVKRGEQVRKDQASSELAAQEASDKAKDAETTKNTDSTATTDKSNNTSTSNGSTQPAVTSTELPDTGIESSIAQMLAIGLMTGTAISFVRSRRSLKRPL